MFYVRVKSSCSARMLSLLILSACATIRETPAGEPAPRLAFIGAKYDGERLKGTLLVGAVAPMTIDRRVRLNSAARALDCASGVAFKQIIEDFLASPASETDLIHLGEGEWYGEDVSYPVFGSKEGPQCIDYKISYGRPVPLSSPVMGSEVQVFGRVEK